MSTPRFYIITPLSLGQKVVLTDPLLRHLHVLRLATGAPVILFNGQGGEYHGTITALGKRAAEVELHRFDAVSRESPMAITIVQAVSAVERMDYTIQKATECGVYAIQPIFTSRCQSRLHGERAEKKRMHWQAIAVSASEQCGRTIIPRVLPLQSLPDYLAVPDDTVLKILLSPAGTTTIDTLPARVARIEVLIGPEGGLTREEESAAIAAGFHPVLLGPRIFRTETVAPVIMGLLQYRYGDFGRL